MKLGYLLLFSIVFCAELNAMIAESDAQYHAYNCATETREFVEERTAARNLAELIYKADRLLLRFPRNIFSYRSNPFLRNTAESNGVLRSDVHALFAEIQHYLETVGPCVSTAERRLIKQLHESYKSLVTHVKLLECSYQ